MAKIAIDCGHGMTNGKYDCGAVGNGLQEADVTLEVGLAVRDRLKAHGFEVVMLRENKTKDYGSASDRGTALGKTGADYALSIHVNAGGGTGAELIMPMKESYGAVEYYMAQEFSKFTKWRKTYSRCYQTGANHNRVIDSKTHKVSPINKIDYYGVPRCAWAKGVSADIIELFFIDTKKDVEHYLGNKSKYVEAIVKAICLGFGVEYKEKTVVGDSTTSNVLYRVIAGSYSVKNNATSIKSQMVALGYGAFLHATTKDGKTLYQVVCGSYANKATAEKIKSELISKGYSAFLQAV